MTEPPFVVWQGFHHRWTYNHRLNRLGDWSRGVSRDDNEIEVETGHSAASGSGLDLSRFTSHAAILRADGVSVREFRRNITLSGIEQAEQIFEREIRLRPDEIPADHEVFAACLSGFDLCADGDADKLSSMHLVTTTPGRDPATGDVVFNVLGALNVDCDSPECDGAGSTGLLLGALAGGGYSIAQMGLIGGPAGAAFGAAAAFLLAKLNLKSRYELTVRFFLISGTQEALAATRSLHANALDWDTETAIRLPTDGVVPVTLSGDDDARWKTSIPAINQISIEVTRERGLLRPDTAMHLLEWDMAVRPTLATGTSCDAELDLFFRNWRNRPSEFFDQVFDVEILDPLVEPFLTHRDAGAANLTVGLTLLQFAEPIQQTRRIVSDEIFWEPSNDVKSADAVFTDTDVYEMGPATEIGSSATRPDMPPPRHGSPLIIATRNAF